MHRKNHKLPSSNSSTNLSRLSNTISKAKKIRKTSHVIRCCDCGSANGRKGYITSKTSVSVDVKAACTVWAVPWMRRYRFWSFTWSGSGLRSWNKILSLKPLKRSNRSTMKISHMSFKLSLHGLMVRQYTAEFCTSKTTNIFSNNVVWLHNFYSIM